MSFTATLEAAAVQHQRQEESASFAFSAVSVSLTEASYTQSLEEKHLCFHILSILVSEYDFLLNIAVLCLTFSLLFK